MNLKEWWQPLSLLKEKYKKSERKMKLLYIPQEIRATQAANTNNFIMMICIKDDFINR